jgi:hypothetical protein
VKSLLELNERDRGFRERRLDPYRTPPPEGRGVWAVPLLCTATFVLVLGAAHWIQSLDPTLILLHRISVATSRYRSETGSYPPDDGWGSASLALALSRRGLDGQPYLNPTCLRTSGQGSLIAPAGGVIHYGGRTAEGKEGFLLWTISAAGKYFAYEEWSR